MKATHKITGEELEVITTFDEHRAMGLRIEEMYHHAPDDITMGWIENTWEMAKTEIANSGRYEAAVIKDGRISCGMFVTIDDIIIS
jgi:hypothetical protein